MESGTGFKWAAFSHTGVFTSYCALRPCINGYGSETKLTTAESIGSLRVEPSYYSVQFDVDTSVTACSFALCVRASTKVDFARKLHKHLRDFGMLCIHLGQLADSGLS